MKSKWYFRVTNDWYIDFRKPVLINIELLSFHWEDHSIWFTILGISLIWERGTYAPVRKNK